MKKQNILYFTSYPLDSHDGGVMAIINDLSQIVQIHNINLYVIIICKEEQKEKAAIQLDKLEINYLFISLKVTPKKPEKTSQKIFYKIRNLVSFWQEMDARFYLQDQVADISKYLTNFCETLSIEIIIFEQLYSVLWFKNFLNLKQKKIYLAFDKEAELFRYLTKYKNAKFFNLYNFIAYLRIKKFEKNICNISDKCVFMSKADIPKYLLNDKKVLINSQIFPPKLIPWHYTNSEIVFFAGSINYYPNFLAVKWLISELSPKLLQLNNKIKIVITGTNYDDMPKDWTIENNVYIPGFIPQQQLENLFQTSDMFICPIDNDFSVKMKLVECVSYGLPFFTTQPCLNALPYLSGLPILEMNKPDEAAAYICDTLSKKEVLEKLNKQILEDAFNFNNTRQDWWKKAILGT
jgi:hypothetical protein